MKISTETTRYLHFSSKNSCKGNLSKCSVVIGVRGWCVQLQWASCSAITPTSTDQAFPCVLHDAKLWAGHGEMMDMPTGDHGPWLSHSGHLKDFVIKKTRLYTR